MSSLIMSRRSLLRTAGGLAAFAAAPLAMPAVIRSAEAACGTCRAVRHNINWVHAGRDPFATDHRRAPEAVHALDGLTSEERAYFLKSVEPLADAGWNHPDTAMFIRPIKDGDSWNEMVNGGSRFIGSVDRPSQWDAHLPREQYVVPLTNPYTGTVVEVSIPKVCYNARRRKREKGRVWCIPLPKAEFDRVAVEA